MMKKKHRVQQLLLLGMESFRLECYDDARRLWLQAYEMDPTNTKALDYLERLHDYEGDTTAEAEMDAQHEVATVFCIPSFAAETNTPPPQAEALEPDTMPIPVFQPTSQIPSAEVGLVTKALPKFRGVDINSLLDAPANHAMFEAPEERRDVLAERSEGLETTVLPAFQPVRNIAALLSSPSLDSYDAVEEVQETPVSYGLTALTMHPELLDMGDEQKTIAMPAFPAKRKTRFLSLEEIRRLRPSDE